MSDRELPPKELLGDRAGEALAMLTREARADEGPEPDWDAIDEKLFARIESEKKPGAAEHVAERRGSPWAWAGLAAAVAAAAAIVVGVRPHVQPAPTAETTASVPASAGTLVGHDGSTIVRIGGAVASEGHSIAAGDRVEVRSGRALFEQQGKVRWSAESGTRLVVEHAASPLVLSLESGAAEAQVTPVPAGEAFAVDVTGSHGHTVRIAVHGTHLRVALAGDHVTVDLTEGIVSVGEPPRRGPTYGTLVVAPAHVELDTTDVAGSLVIEHVPAKVRPAQSLVVSAPPATVALTPPPPAAKASTGAVPPPVVAMHVDRPPSPAVSAHPDPAVAPEVVERNPNASADLAAAVQACIQSAPHSADIRVTISSRLLVTVGEDGFVQNARFDPPLTAGEQDCAARTIYRKTRFTKSGSVIIPVEVQE